MIVALAVGASIAVATIAFTAQRYFEAARRDHVKRNRLTA